MIFSENRFPLFGIMLYPTIEADRPLRYTKAWRSSAGRLSPLRPTTFGDEIGDEARLCKCSDVNLGRPILGLETAGRAIALRDGLHRVPPQLRVVTGDPHCHVAADIDRDGRDIAVRIRK